MWVLSWCDEIGLLENSLLFAAPYRILQAESQPEK
jgi:hypothetical protein